MVRGAWGVNVRQHGHETMQLGARNDPRYDRIGLQFEGGFFAPGA